jgi:hypothetical protein
VSRRLSNIPKWTWNSTDNTYKEFPSKPAAMAFKTKMRNDRGHASNPLRTPEGKWIVWYPRYAK